MGQILGFLKSKPVLFALGMVAGVAVDRRTGGKVTMIVSKVPFVGPVILG